jgi:hypothetical protein
MMGVVEVGASVLLVAIGLASWWMIWPRKTVLVEAAPAERPMFTGEVGAEDNQS